MSGIAVSFFYASLSLSSFRFQVEIRTRSTYSVSLLQVMASFVREGEMDVISLLKICQVSRRLKDMLPRMYFDRHCTMGDDDGGQTGFPPPKSIRAREHLHRVWNGEAICLMGKIV